MPEKRTDAEINADWTRKLRWRQARLQKALRAVELARNAVAAAKRVLKRHPKPVLPTRMYDHIYPEQIPPSAPAVAGYVGGKWPTFANGTLAKLFPKARRLSVAVASRFDADCLDIEPGDATPAVAPGWVKRQWARGVKFPKVYCSVSDVAEVLAALSAAGIKRNQIRLWTAHYTHVPHTCGPKCWPTMRTLADATQFTNRSLGRSLDESLCKSAFWDGHRK